MVSFLLLALVAGVTGQQCTCDEDATNGYWTGPTCATCDVLNHPLDTTLTPPGGSNCLSMDICKDTTRNLAQRACYGVGLCVNNPAAPCNCTAVPLYATANLAGMYCEKCKAGFTGWPQCITPVCQTPYTNSPSCNSKGTCDDNAAPLSCGVTGCLSTTQVLQVGGIPQCTPAFYLPEVQTCQTNALGAAFSQVVPAGSTVCGATSCPFGMKCANAAQGVCCYSDYVVCNSRDTSKQTTCCAPSGQTCCEGVCCDSGHTCTAIVNRNFVVTTQMVNTVWSGGTFTQLVPGQPGYSGAYGGGAWTSWKMLDGSTSTPWHVCSTQYLGAVATTRVIILPMALIFAVIISLILVWQTAGLNPLMVAIPAIILVLCSIFLFFSIFWTVGVVIALAALFGMAVGHKGGSAFLVAMIFELFALAVVCGGLGLGQFFYADNLGGDLFASVNGAHLSTWGALATCSNYYDFFVIDPNNVPYNGDPTATYTDYCSNGWYTYIGLVADIVVTFQIVMLTATGVAYLRGGAGGPSKTV